MRWLVQSQHDESGDLRKYLVYILFEIDILHGVKLSRLVVSGERNLHRRSYSISFLSQNKQNPHAEKLSYHYRQ